jgi:hypothetical protein
MHEGNIRDVPAKTLVAVKQSRGEISLSDIRDFFAEIDVMKRFSKPHHDNVSWSHTPCPDHQVVRLLGICTRERPLMIIMEFMGLVVLIRCCMTQSTGFVEGCAAVLPRVRYRGV